MGKEDKGDDYKFGVEDLAAKLDIEPASARIKLRNADIKKAPTGRYGWKTKADLEEVVEKLSSKKSSGGKSKGDDADEKSSKKNKDKGADKKADKKAGDKKGKGKK